MRLIRCDYPGCGAEVPEARVTATVPVGGMSQWRWVSVDVCPEHARARPIEEAAKAVAARVAKEGKE